MLTLVEMSLGNLIKEWREANGLSQSALAKRLGVDRQTVSNIETGKTRRLQSEAMQRFSELSGVPAPELVLAARKNGHAVADIPSGLEPGSVHPEPPEWELDVRAGPWSHAPVCALDPDDPAQNYVLRTGRFRIRILGTCMEPEYPDGSTTEFQVVRIDSDGFEIGRDYVVCKNDDTATFKRLVAIHPDTISLAALNQKDYPGLLVVARQEISRIARAVAKVVPVGPGKVPKIRRG